MPGQRRRPSRTRGRSVTPGPADPDSLDIVEFIMAIETSIGRQLTDEETQALADRLRALLARDPDLLDNDDLLLSLVREFKGEDDDDLLGVRMPKPDPDAPQPRSGRASVHPEDD
jgi:hypothetical protein